jgi:hypothetical protein
MVAAVAADFAATGAVAVVAAGPAAAVVAAGVANRAGNFSVR